MGTYQILPALIVHLSDIDEHKVLSSNIKPRVTSKMSKIYKSCPQSAKQFHKKYFLKIAKNVDYFFLQS